MKTTVCSESFGEIIYEENAWTGKKDLSINGVQLNKTSKKTFEYNNGESVTTVTLKGSVMSGVTATIGDETVKIVTAPKWYEIALSVFIFAFVLVWGNSVALCSIFPIVGGAIGGAISGALAVVNLMVVKNIKNIGGKILVSIGIFVLTVAICATIAFVLLSTM